MGMTAPTKAYGLAHSFVLQVNGRESRTKVRSRRVLCKALQGLSLQAEGDGSLQPSS